MDNMDLSYWRDLLRLLKESGVQGFSRGDTAITFYRDWDPELVSVDGKEVKAEQTHDVRGFKPTKPESAFKNPTLWANQGGRPYSFDGQ